MTTDQTSYGVNVDSEGTVVGLWFDPGVIQHDEKDYWFVPPGELRRLLTWRTDVNDVKDDVSELIEVEVIQSFAHLITFDADLLPSAGSEGIFERVDSVDLDTGTLIFYGTDGLPYEVRVRRVTGDDCIVDPAGIVPPPIVVRVG